MDANEQGSYCLRNWKAKLDGKDWTSAFEYPVFTDAQVDIRAGIIKEIGAYSLFRIDPFSSTRFSNQPAFIQREYHYLEFELPKGA